MPDNLSNDQDGNADIIRYINACLKKGKNREEITQALVQNGWDRNNVESIWIGNESRIGNPTAKKPTFAYVLFFGLITLLCIVFLLSYGFDMILISFGFAGLANSIFYGWLVFISIGISYLIWVTLKKIHPDKKKLILMTSACEIPIILMYIFIRISQNIFNKWMNKMVSEFTSQSANMPISLSFSATHNYVKSPLIGLIGFLLPSLTLFIIYYIKKN